MIIMPDMSLNQTESQRQNTHSIWHRKDFLSSAAKIDKTFEKSRVNCWKLAGF